ncbi:hypothetical protein JXA84_05455 [candidate division WOR-3 bacterium]|nr:hypothetical protein [candidate division WOR-3 bacterium]
MNAVFSLFFMLTLSHPVSDWLEEDSIFFEKPDDNTWIVPYSSSLGGTINIGILTVEEEWVLVMTPLFEIPSSYPSDAFKQVTLANYQMNQLKLGLSEEGYLFLQVEMPYHTVTKADLLNNIEFVAYAVDQNLATIASWFGIEL